MSPQYFLVYIVLLILFIRGMRRWKKKLTAAGRDTSVPYAVACGLGGTAMFFLGVTAFLLSLFITKSWYIFTDKRKEYITEEFGITDGDGVCFRHYQVSFGGPDGSNVFLELTCEGDVREMLETHCLGELTVYSQDGFIWSADTDANDPYAQPISTDDREYYEYKYRRRYHVSVIKETDGKKYVMIR